MSASCQPPARCPACDTSPCPRFLLANDAWLQQCPRCLMAWWHWPAFDPAAFYDRSYFQSADTAKGYDDYAALEAGVRQTARARLQRIARLARAPAPSPQTMLEIGCGTGVFLDEARGAGWQARGVEVSPYAVAEACGRGLEVTLGCAEDLALGRALLDCVVLWDTIEHVRDPAGVLHRASAALRPGGVLALSTGDVTSLCARLSGPRWHLFNLPEHLYFFSPAALQRLLARVGCVVVRITREVNWLPVRYLLERVRKSPGDLGNVMRHAAALLMSSPLAHTVVPATLGDVLGVYAVKTRAGV